MLTGLMTLGSLTAVANVEAADNNVNLHTLAQAIKPLAKDNYRIEKAKPAEAVAYEKIKTYDADKNDVIDISEFRNYYLGTLKIKTVSVTVSDEACLAADAILNAEETDDP